MNPVQPTVTTLFGFPSGPGALFPSSLYSKVDYISIELPVLSVQWRITRTGVDCESLFLLIPLIYVFSHFHCLSLFVSPSRQTEYIL